MVFTDKLAALNAAGYNRLMSILRSKENKNNVKKQSESDWDWQISSQILSPDLNPDLHGER